MVAVYASLILFGLNEFRKAPIGFITQVDQGYFIIVAQLPGGASLTRTDEVNRRIVERGYGACEWGFQCDARPGN
jgi:multidrug efflux pump subunit AcrB